MSSTKITKPKRPKIKYGNIEIPEEDFDPRNIKFRVTMFMDVDLLDEIRKRAKSKRMPYQRLINDLLRGVVLGHEDEQRIRQIVREELAKKGS